LTAASVSCWVWGDKAMAHLQTWWIIFFIRNRLECCFSAITMACWCIKAICSSFADITSFACLLL